MPAVQIELDLYSGRPNPAWSLTPEEARVLVERLRRLPRASVDFAPEEPLGYRGLRIVGAAGDASIALAAGVVTTIDDRGQLERHVDDRRSLECWLLRTAQGRLDEALRRMALAGAEPACE